MCVEITQKSGAKLLNSGEKTLLLRQNNSMLDLLNIKKLAADAGFDLCGVAPCRHLSEGEARFRAWLARGGQSSLGYMERNAEKRFDPRLLVEGARTAVVCAVSYKNAASEGYPAGHRTKIASYACTADYHTTIRAMLAQLFEALRAAYPGLGGRAFTDTPRKPDWAGSDASRCS